MIKKLRHKFMGIVSISLLIVLAAIIGVINTANYQRNFQRLYERLDIIYENNGELPKKSSDSSDLVTGETKYSTRYFIVTYTDGKAETNLKYVASINKKTALTYGQRALENRNGVGRIRKDNLYLVYKTYEDNNTTTIIFIDGTEVASVTQDLLRTSLMIGAIAFIFFVIVVYFMSSWALRPIIKSYETQSEFITNAGHELKTPLAVISANMEVLEMLEGPNEWTTSTLNQVKRLSGLVSNLMSLVRFNEREDMVFKDLDYSEIVENVVKDFKTVATKEKKTLTSSIEKDIHIKGDDKVILELVNIFLDNAIKYCDDEGTIEVNLYKKGKNSHLLITNDYLEGEGVDYSQFFNRFYREDKSHNSEKSGYGIGLSMAESIVTNMKGKINVTYKDKKITFEIIL